MQVIENEVASGKTIVLDEKHFVNGHYTKCILIYSGGEFASINTKFDNCQVNLSGAAQRTANLLGSFGLVKPPDGAQLGQLKAGGVFGGIQ